ncbi:MAG: hypothetical protein E5Y32_04420 [Mesorhizobium sp.]|nr:MAG: hypothetical protein E5Y32_04420 [Mesorhizobium sp.]
MSAVICTREMLRTTIDILRRGGECRHERVVLWLSTAAVRTPASIIEVYEPEQIADIDYFKLPPTSMQALMDHLRSTRRRIVAQIHTHPGRAYHSDVDAKWPIIRHVGALSLVLPHFAATTTPENFLTEVMTYEYSPAGGWDHCSNSGLDARLMVTA